GYLGGEGDERRVQGQATPVRAVPERQFPRRPERDRLVPRALVRDDPRAAEHAVAERVVAVVVGVHHGAHRRGRDVRDRVEGGLGPAPRRARVDADDPLGADEKTGVVDPPGAVGLHVGVDSGGHLVDLGPAGDGDVAALAAHLDHPSWGGWTATGTRSRTMPKWSR